MRQVVAVLIVLAVGYYLVTLVQVWRAARSDDERRSQAIIVLGAAQYNGRPSPDLRARLDHAADLYPRHVAPVVVVTGGKQPGDQFTEASAGANYLHTRGVPDSAVQRESTSHSSWESLLAASRFLRPEGIRRVVLVSDPFHSLRIRLIATDVGLDAVTSPTRTSPITGLDEWWRFASEALGVSVGRIFGFGSLARASKRVRAHVPAPLGAANLTGPSGVV
ncbi:MAG TPA: YdcF family protein [Acidimicrobiia bacterium]|nr:YdcF family protein [Acidimicrobiia bacterium]